MKYDVFISYARKDFDEVNSFVEMLKERIPQLAYWFDITGIESGDEFDEKIIAAIDNSDIVLFALSDNSLQSQWAKDEVMYAKNTDKKVVPLLLKGASLKGWFLFRFGRIDCIDTTIPMQVDKLIGNILNWTGMSNVPKTNTYDKFSIRNKSRRLDKHVEQELTPYPYEAVDLGLSVKWATFNVGATKPEEIGEYYAWGEVKEKEYYDENTYKHLNTDIGKNICGTKYDVAHVKWGGNWRMPTIAEVDELEECVQEWTNVNGVIGLKIIGPNGNNIFLPVTGMKEENLIYCEDSGLYWVGEMGNDVINVGMKCPCKLTFNEVDTLDGDIFIMPLAIDAEHYGGCPVRPVCD